MKVKSLQISNIWSFGYFEDIQEAPKMVFNGDLSIVIGQNGAGKSTALEVINFIFRRVLLVPYVRDLNLYGQKATIPMGQRRSILTKAGHAQNYRGFHLEKNYDFEQQRQWIRIVVEVDDIDRANLSLLQAHRSELASIIGEYSVEQMFADEQFQNEYQIDIELNSHEMTFVVHVSQDMGFNYLSNYNFYKESIEIYNEEHPDSRMDNLSETFSLIGSYRNYTTYSPAVSLSGGNTAERQIQQLRTNEESKSMSSTENSEPTIFSLVRVRMAGECFNLIDTRMDREECQRAANELTFVKSINEKLKMVSLKVEILLTDLSSWNFAFAFVDTRRNRTVTDIGSLSAGQKAIVHLVFEAYGRGNLSGGLVIIDEPEIHLHYQFQNEYLRVIEELNREQACQYILVTHSEALISSNTINNVIRLALDDSGYSKVYQPTITADQKWLVKILDNNRSTHAFFGSKVLLVEGDSDRYFFRALLGEIEEKTKHGLSQDIAILDMGGKDKESDWRELFQSFGLEVFFETDLDSAIRFYPGEQRIKVDTRSKVNDFLASHPDATTRIDQAYANNIFILKEGDLEAYLDIPKDLANVITKCRNGLRTYFDDIADSKIQELRNIMSCITGIPEPEL
jgi:predicted ATP-dependent endonuclease of OLD family